MTQSSRTLGKAGNPVAQSMVSRQGQLDSLCGLYAVINAIMLVVGDDVRRPGIRKLLSDAGVDQLASEGYLAEAFKEGMPFRVLCRMFNAVAVELEALEGIAVRYSIAANPSFGIDAFTERMATHLATHGPGSAILVVHGYIDHWTVVSAIDAHRVHLADCYGFRYFKRPSLKTDKDELPERRHELWPTQSLLLRRSKPKKT